MIGFVDDDTKSFTRFSRVSKIFNSSKIGNNFRKIIGGEIEFGITLYWKEMTSGFYLIKASVERVVRIPFAIRCHEEVTCIDLENA